MLSRSLIFAYVNLTLDNWDALALARLVGPYRVHGWTDGRFDNWGTLNCIPGGAPRQFLLDSLALDV